MNKEPETYAELMRQKRCVELTKYFVLTKAQIEQIYQFLTDNPEGKVSCSGDIIKLIAGQKVELINTQRTSTTIDTIECSNSSFDIISHYTSSGSYSGGSSSNNNNNNNNNNNR